MDASRTGNETGEASSSNRVKQWSNGPWGVVFLISKSTSRFKNNMRKVKRRKKEKDKKKKRKRKRKNERNSRRMKKNKKKKKVTDERADGHTLLERYVDAPQNMDKKKKENEEGKEKHEILQEKKIGKVGKTKSSTEERNQGKKN